MTVSRVINAETNVREETRAKVAASVKALRYAPNLAARSLASADALHLGILYSNPSAAYLSEFLLGSLEQSSLAGCQLVIERCDSDENQTITRLIQGGVHGVILPAPLCDSEAALGAVAQAQVPAVLVASGRPAAGLSAVSINDFEASRAMTRYLLELGHRRIGFINGHPNQTASGQRFRGYIEGMTEAGLSVGTDQVAQGYFTYRSGLEAADKLLTAWKPTAIFASNDDMAAATVAVAHRLHLDVPVDVSVCGFDDTAIASTIWPELTTIRQPIGEMSRRAIELLSAELKQKRGGGRPEPTTVTLGYELIRRDSDAAPTLAKRSARGKG